MATRCDLLDSSDPANLPPEQRQREVAAILAAGVIRMCMRRGATSSNRRSAACISQISPDSGETRLELSRPSSPDGQCG